MTAPYGAINDAGRVLLSEEVNWKFEKKPCKTSEVVRGSGRQIRKLSPNKPSRMMDVPKYNQIRNAFARVLDSDAGACLYGSFWNRALN